jgi:UTP--glucose-1-phosphate uridylyltransferase
LLADDVMVDDARVLRSMLALHEREGGSVLALMEVAPSQISSYGAVAVDPHADGSVRVRSIVEKPSPQHAPSNLAVIGRYVLEPEIFDALDQIEPGVAGELQITDAIGALLKERPVFGVVFTTGRFDIGRKLEFMMANLELGLERPDLGPDLAVALSELVRRRGLG